MAATFPESPARAAPVPNAPRNATAPTARYSALGPLFGVLVAVLCLLPFALVLAISVGEKIEGASWRWSFDPSHYVRFFVGIDWPASVSLLYPKKLVYSFGYAAVAAVLAVALAFPFAWSMTRQCRRAQTVWLVVLLSVVSLSEVFVVMGWDVLLSNRSGLPMVAREIGLTGWLKDAGWFPALRDLGLANPRDLKFKTSSFAVILTMTYLVWPYAVILLFPALSRIDDSLLDAARTMGARPRTVLVTVVIPAVRLPLVGATLLLFVFLLGVYVTVSVFAAPATQTLTISIYQSVRGATLDAPFGAAQAVVLLIAAAACLGASRRLASRSRRDGGSLA